MIPQNELIDGDDYLVKFWDEIWMYHVWMVMSWNGKKLDAAYISIEYQDILVCYPLEKVKELCEEFFRD